MLAEKIIYSLNLLVPMKKIILLFFAFGFVLSLLTSCGEDDPILGDPIETPPSIILATGDDFVSKAENINVGDAFRVKLQLFTGTRDLSVLRFFENGSLIPASRLEITGLTANNPLLIVGDAKKGVTYEVKINPDPTVNTERVISYAFEVEDEAKKTTVVSVDITTIIPFTAIEKTLMGVLLNQAGPSGTGGLDLDTGESVGSRDTRADIKDQGINLDRPATDNWRRQIAGANGAEVRKVNLSDLAENLTFSNVQFQEQILDAFTKGKELEGVDIFRNSRGDKIATDDDGNEKVSQPIVVGDIFAVKRDNKHYLIECVKVNNTTNNNNDSYEFNIKF